MDIRNLGRNIAGIPGKIKEYAKAGPDKKQDLEESSTPMASSEGTIASVPRDIHEKAPAPVEEQHLPLSFADRISLTSGKKQVAEAYYQVGRELAKRVTGDADHFRYEGVGLTNLDEAASLWSLQAKHGDVATTLRSVPVTVTAMALGALNNVPIEGAKVEGGRLVETHASGHNLNPLLNIASLVAAGVSFAMVPGFAPLALAAPLLTAAVLAVQRFGSTNAPVHEMTHGIQFLLAGDLLNRGMIDESDFVAIQNDTNAIGYLWGGETEKAARASETTGDIKPVFDVIRKRVAERLEERYSMGAQPVIEQANKLLDGHQDWMTRELAGRLPAPPSS
ncbi:MAG: hypothetical protein RDV48_18730 [Candidatus Eremiobacteraeota bacterium]|nr:hypothetical protein [Candidatus Eremiobacteraeota bacterium]